MARVQSFNRSSSLPQEWSKQTLPGTAQSFLEAENRAERNVHVTRFNLLQCTGMEVGHFCQFLLRQLARLTYITQVFSKSDQIRIFTSTQRHNVLGGNSALTTTPFRAYHLISGVMKKFIRIESAPGIPFGAMGRASVASANRLI